MAPAILIALPPVLAPGGSLRRWHRANGANRNCKGSKGCSCWGGLGSRAGLCPPPGLGSGRDPGWLWVGIGSRRALLSPDNAGIQGDLHPRVVPGCHGALWGAGVKHRGCCWGSPFVTAPLVFPRPRCQHRRCRVATRSPRALLFVRSGDVRGAPAPLRSLPSPIWHPLSGACPSPV